MHDASSVDKGRRTDDEIMDVGSTMSEMFRLGKHAMRTTLIESHEELTAANVGILINLGRLAPCRVAHLADYLFLDASTVSRQVDQLVNRGLVERITDPDDRRAIQLSPTEQGQALLSQVSDERCALWRRTLDIFSDDELATLAELHRRLIHRLDTVVGSDLAESES